MKLLLLLVALSTTSIAAQNAAKCTKMTERKEMNDLTEAEWIVYSSTIEKATHTLDPETNLTIWEAAYIKHLEISDQLHGDTPMFGYGHRMFLKWFEEKLQQINPNFAFFYWDHGREFSTWSKSKIWNYLGTNDGLVKIPAFDGVKFASQYRPELLRHSQTYKNPPPSEYYFEMWDSMKDNGYSDYCSQLQVAHGVMHSLVGGEHGHMAKLDNSPLDPFFYAHHSFIDYTLMKAQSYWAAANYPLEKTYGPDLNLNTTMPGFPDIVLADVLDMAHICVKYVPSGENVDSSISIVDTTSGTNSTQNSKNFTFDLPNDWLNSTFKNKSQDIKNQAEEIVKSFNGKVDRGEIRISNIGSTKRLRASNQGIIVFTWIFSILSLGLTVILI